MTTLDQLPEWAPSGAQTNTDTPSSLDDLPEYKPTANGATSESGGIWDAFKAGTARQFHAGVSAMQGANPLSEERRAAQARGEPPSMLAVPRAIGGAMQAASAPIVAAGGQGLKAITDTLDPLYNRLTGRQIAPLSSEQAESDFASQILPGLAPGRGRIGFVPGPGAGGPYEIPASQPNLALVPNKPPPVAPQPGPLGVTLSEGQATGDIGAIRKEQAAYRGQSGPRAQKAAEAFREQQAQEVETAAERVRAGFDPFGQTVAKTPQEAGGVVSHALAQTEATRAALAGQDTTSLSAGIDRLPHPLDAADTVANSLRNIHQAEVNTATQGGQRLVAEREGIRSSLNPGGNILARSPQEAADIISGSVGNQAERAQQATSAGYEQLANLPGQFHPATFNNIGDIIRSRLNSGTEPIRINPQTTPIANDALRDLDDIIGNIQQTRNEAGQIQPRQPITPALVDDVRKRLNSFYGDAISTARSSNNFSDVRATRGIMNAFDDYVSDRLNRGTFIGGDASQVSQTMQNARALHANYRRTFMPQGPGDAVGSAIQNIVGRYEGQAAPPGQIAQWLYGGGAMPTKIATRLMGIFGDNGPEAAALRQGYLSHIVERPEGVTAWGPEQVANRIFDAINGRGRELSQIYFSPEMRTRLLNYANDLRNSIPPEIPANDVVTRTVNRLVGAGGGQPATSAETADILFGRGTVGTNPIGVKIAQRIMDTQGANSDAFTAIRQGIMSRLTDAASGRVGFDPAKTAERINSFLSDARPMAETVFSQQERQTLANYATRLEQHAKSIAEPTDEVERAIARISGQNGQPATPTEVADMLYGRAGTGDRGMSVRLAARLKSDLGQSSPQWSAVKQGMFSRLVEPAEGKQEWGAQKISERLHEFLNGNGKPLSDVMFSPEERNMIRQFADLNKSMIIPKTGANTSDTATFLHNVLNKISGKIGAALSAGAGYAIAHHLGLPAEVGFVAGGAASQAGAAVSNMRSAAQISRQMPLIAEAMQRYQKAAAAWQKANSGPARVALSTATTSLGRALQNIGIDVRQLNTVTTPAPAGADQNQQK